MKKLLISLVFVVIIMLVAVTGGSYYMLSFSLAPDTARTDTALCFMQLAEKHPEVSSWLDSLKANNALRDTFVNMPRGERHHAYFIRHEDKRPVAVVLHGWRDCAIDFMHIGRIYEQMGFNVLMPDLHAHGLSEGDAIEMGWKERHDVMHWICVASRLFDANDFVVHGVSMGAATAMNLSGEKMPACVKDIRFVEDCGYTSVWDEFSYELKEQFSLPPFPLMYTTSLLCKLRYGWSFGEAAPLEQVKRCRYPMLFIHGGSDTFVPTRMVHPLYQAKQGEKELWIAKDSEHAMSYTDHTDDYVKHIKGYYWTGK